MPNAEQARQVVAEMEKLRNSGWTWDKNGMEYADFSCLRYPVYLPVLLDLGRAHHQEAIEGIAAMASPEGTAALIELLAERRP